MTGLFVGVDGGGSHTAAVLGRRGGAVLARGEAGPSNPSALGFDAAVNAIEAAVRAAVGESAVDAVALGVAGAGRPADRARLEELLRVRLGIERLQVVQDVALLLPAAGLASGVAIVAGTGSSVFAVAPDGRTATAGGWGYLLGDEGSAYAVGREALRAVGRQTDGFPEPTALTPALVAHLSLAQPRDLITAVYQSNSPRATVAGLAPLVVEVARRGDPAARATLADAGRELGETAVAAGRRLRLTAGAPVVIVGGMLAAGDLMLAPLRQALAAGGLGELTPLADDPALGALRLATGEVPFPTII